MLDIDELRATLNNADSEMKKNIGHLDTMAKDARRVSEVAKNANIIIDNIDRQFEEKTKLTKIDIGFLFLAVALQVVRQYLVTNFKERPGHKEAAEDAKKIETTVLGEEEKEDAILRKNARHAWYHPSLEEVTFNPVPFDQTAGLSGLGGAFEHRAKTPGHDPILGYVFGTANIVTATLTTWDLQSFHIKYGEIGGGFKPMGTNRADTGKVFHYAKERLLNEGEEGKIIMAVSLFREAMHLKSDVNSKASLPVPFVSSLSPDFAKELAKYGLDMANIATVGRQMTYSMLINYVIALLHRLMYESNGGGNLSYYEVRTRKILSYSNAIASASNLIVVAILSAVALKSGELELGKKALEYLDIGGLLVTVYRIATDSNFIGKLKREFLEKEFYNVVMGDDFDF